MEFYWWVLYGFSCNKAGIYEQADRVAERKIMIHVALKHIHQNALPEYCSNILEMKKITLEIHVRPKTHFGWP